MIGQRPKRSEEELFQCMLPGWGIDESLEQQSANMAVFPPYCPLI